MEESNEWEKPRQVRVWPPECVAAAREVLGHLLAHEVVATGGSRVTLAQLATRQDIDPQARAAFEEAGLLLVESHIGPRSRTPDGQLRLFVWAAMAELRVLRGPRWKGVELRWALVPLPDVIRRQRMFGGRKLRSGLEVPLAPYVGQRTCSA